jgi:hypothetical protein
MNPSVGIGFRRDFAEAMLHSSILKPSFIEIAPENWIDLGGYWKKILKQASERFPITCHGLSLSLGSAEELDWEFLKKIKYFLKEYDVQIYSEHLSYTKCGNAHLYDLLPIPFTEDAVKHVANRIKQVQDYLERRILIENVSYYTSVSPEMDEASFIRQILQEADCGLLLDVNNVYVNSFNHHYDAKEFLNSLPLDRVEYIHMAGHEKVSEELIIDTHGEAIIDSVFELFEWTTQKTKPVPVLLERDFNIPELDELQAEITKLQTICINQRQTEYAS